MKSTGATKERPVGAAASIPAVLLSYQQAWVNDASLVAVWEKSRRIGASWCDASDSVLMAAPSDGQDALYIGYAQDMTREYIDDCAMWAKAFNQVAGAVQETVFVDTDANGRDPRDIKAYRIDFASGNKILALSSRPRSIRGKQGKVTIDEAAFHDDLPGLLKAALALLIWGGKVRVLSSHNGAENPFNQLIQDIRAGRLPYSLHRTTFDDALEAGLYRRVCLKKGVEWSAAGEAEWKAMILGIYKGNEEEELYCIPRDGSGAWLTRVLIEACMYDAPVVRWKSPPGFVHWPEEARAAECEAWCERELAPLLEALDKSLTSFMGNDFARYMDLSVMAPMVLERNLTRRVPFLVELADCPFDQQRQIYFYVVDRLPRFRKGYPDASGNGSYLAEVAMQRYGSRIEPVVFSQSWYRDNTAPFKAAFEDKTLLVPRDAGVLDDLRAFEVVRGIPCMPELRRKDADGQVRHGDAGIALLLAYQASRSDYVPCDEWQSTGVARASGQYQDYFPA